MSNSPGYPNNPATLLTFNTRPAKKFETTFGITGNNSHCKANAMYFFNVMASGGLYSSSYINSLQS